MRKRDRPRATTRSPKQLITDLGNGRWVAPYLIDPKQRPQSRAECLGMDRPCPFVGCRHHLYLDVNEEVGSIKFNFPDLVPWEMDETCSLNAASARATSDSPTEHHTLEHVGDLTNLTRERVRQVELRGLLKLRRAFAEIGFGVEWMDAKLADYARSEPTVNPEAMTAEDEAQSPTGDGTRVKPTIRATIGSVIEANRKLDEARAQGDEVGVNRLNRKLDRLISSF